MNKLLKTILIISIAILGAGVLFASPVCAQPPIDPLVVQFETMPLFNEANFLPGESVTRWVKVTNNSGSIQRIATEAINKTDPKNLSEKLNLVIKEGTNEIFNNTLKKFFDQGETYLSDLGNGLTTQYDFTISFNSETDNSFQGKALGFDILVGFEGTEGGLPLPPPGGGTSGGGGNPLPLGLTIYNEALLTVATTSVTITWTTSYNSTTQVIYAAEGEAHTLDLNDYLGDPPKYGYAHTTLEYDTVPKVINHSVTITGLTPGTTYYFRTVSHGSLAVSQEHAFTTLEEQIIILPPFIPPFQMSGNEISGGNIAMEGETTEGTTLMPQISATETAFPEGLAGAIIAVIQGEATVPPFATAATNLNLFSALAMAGQEIFRSGLRGTLVIILIIILILIITGKISQMQEKIKIKRRRKELNNSK